MPTPDQRPSSASWPIDPKDMRQPTFSEIREWTSTPIGKSKDANRTYGHPEQSMVGRGRHSRPRTR